MENNDIRTRVRNLMNREIQPKVFNKQDFVDQALSVYSYNDIVMLMQFRNLNSKIKPDTLDNKKQMLGDLWEYNVLSKRYALYLEALIPCRPTTTRG